MATNIVSAAKVVALHCISCQSRVSVCSVIFQFIVSGRGIAFTNIDSPGNETEPESWPEPVLLHQHGLDHVEHRHGVHLVAADDVDDDHHVGGGDEPARPVEGDEDVLVDVFAEGPVADERDGQVARGDDDVGDDDALPHGLLGRLPRRRRDGRLDLQHHVVPGVRERHVPQRTQEAEHLPRRGRRAQAVVGDGVRVGRHSVRRRRDPRDRRVADRHDGGGERDAGDGVEVGELGEHEVDGGEDHDEVAELDVLAPVMADHVVELVQGLAAGDHVHDVEPHLHHQLLRHHDPEAQLLAERVLPQLVVPVEPLPGDALVHLHHLPERVHRDDPRQDQHRDADAPANHDIGRKGGRRRRAIKTACNHDMTQPICMDGG